jgi:TP901 family phage tail tape measure protein
VGGLAVKEAASFESAVNIMGVAASGAGMSLDVLRQAALEVGEDTQLIGIDAMEAADAITVLLKSGMSATDVFGNLDGYLEGTADLGGALRASVDLAAASNLEFAESADAISVALATFGRPASEATAIADNFVATADASIAEVRDLTEAFVNVGPTANQFGWRLEDVNTALALLSQRGIRGSEAGTALKSMMTNMMRPTDAVVGTLDRLNVSLYDQEGQMRTLPDIMADLESALGGLNEEERNLAIQTLAGTYGMKAMATLVTEGAEGWQEMEAAIGDAASSQEVADARTRGLAGAFEQLQGTIQTLMIEAGDPLIKHLLTPGVKWLTEFLDAFSDSGAIDVFAQKVKGLGEYLFGRESFMEDTEFGMRFVPAQPGAIDRWMAGIREGFANGDWSELFAPLEAWIDSGAYQQTFRDIGSAVGQFLGDTIAAALGDEGVSNAMARNLGKALARVPAMISWAAWQAGIEAGSKLRPLIGKEELSPERREAMGRAGVGGMLSSIARGLWDWQMSAPQRDWERLHGSDVPVPLTPTVNDDEWAARGVEAAQQFQRGWESVIGNALSTSGLLIDARAAGVR